MTFVTLKEAQSKPPELIQKQIPCEEFLITMDGNTLAKLVVGLAPPRKVIQLATSQGSFLSREPFDCPLKDFKATSGQVVEWEQVDRQIGLTFHHRAPSDLILIEQALGSRRSVAIPFSTPTVETAPGMNSEDTFMKPWGTERRFSI